jgi:hypothetical protein
MKQMRKKLLLVGILAVTLSTISATQYVRADLGFSYEIVHPSDADIRYIGSDNAGDGLRVLRGNDRNGTYGNSNSVELYFGEWAENITKVYTAAFAIVNEEQFAVNITNVKVTMGSGVDYMKIYLHTHGDKDASGQFDGPYPGNSTLVWNKTDVTHTAWTLQAGNQQSHNAKNSIGGLFTTEEDNTSDVRVASIANQSQIAGDLADFVWVQIVLEIPSNAPQVDYRGTIEFTFESTTELP